MTQRWSAGRPRGQRNACGAGRGRPALHWMAIMNLKERISLKPPYLGPRLQRAFRYAAEKHVGQTRKQSAVPYLSHLLAVASLVLEAGGDEDLAIAALLHDVVEDCGGMPRLREIRKRFGARVAKIVEGCTDSFGEPKPEWVRAQERLSARSAVRRRGDAAGFGLRQTA